MHKQIQLAAAVTLKAAAGDTKKKPTFTVQVYNGDPFRPDSAFRDAPIVIALAGVAVARENLPVLLDHNQNADGILGQTTRIVISQAAIDVEGSFAGADVEGTAAYRVLALARDGFQFQASVGMMLGQVKYVAAGGGANVNGRTVNGPVYIAETSTLREISFVSIGADGDANVRIAARQKASKTMDFHEWLKAKGFDPTNLSDAQRDSLLKAYQAEGASLTASGDVDPLAPVRVARERQTKLRASIERATTRFPQRLGELEALAACAVAEDWTPERFDLEIFRNVEHGGPIPDNRLTASAGLGTSAEVIECAFLRVIAGDTIARRIHGDQVMNASERCRVRGFDSLAETILRARGESLPRTSEAAIRAAMRPGTLRASGGPSTMDLGQAIGNTARRYLSEVALSMSQTWRSVAAVRPAIDFRPHHEVAGVLNDANFKRVAPGGELLHYAASDTAFTRQIDTFGRTLAIDRRDLINDDVGIIPAFVRSIAQAWVVTLNDEFWAMMLDAIGTAYYDASNEITGGDTVLGAPSMAAVIQLLRDRKNEAGSPLDIIPFALCVPTALEMQARALLKSATLERSQATGDQEPTANAIAELGLALVVESRLGGTFHANSSDTQFLVTASPGSQTPCAYASFLNNVQTPTIEQIVETGNTLGLRIRAFSDAGFNLGDPRGIVRSAGA